MTWRIWQNWVFGLIGLAVLLRAFIPLGYMPDLEALAQGQIQIVVCTGSGPQTVSVAADFDPQHKSHPDTTKTEHGLFCLIGVTAHALSLPLGLIVLFIVAAFATPIVYVVWLRVWRSTSVDGLAFPRGPPVFS